MPIYSYLNGKLSEVDIINFGNVSIPIVYYFENGNLITIWEEGNFMTADGMTFVTADNLTFNVLEIENG